MAKYSEPFDNGDYYSDDPVGFNQQPQKRKVPAIFGALLLLVGGSFFVQTTLAAPATVNFLSDVEFGQGVVTTTACDPDGITVTPTSSFVNEAGGGDHKLTFIKLSGIDSNACDGKTFRIKAYGDDGDSPLNLFEYKITAIGDDQILESKSHNSIEINAKVVNDSANFTWSSGGTDGDDVIPDTNDDLEQTAFTLKLVSIAMYSPVSITRTPLAFSEEIKRITVETIDTTCRQGVGCEIGDVGPGGGIVFYKNLSGFDCGPYDYEATCYYLEAAPNNWFNLGVGVEDPRRTWSSAVNQSVLVYGAYGQAVGTGYQNSLDIASQDGNSAANSAAVLAREFDGGGKSDWYLPAINELLQLQANKSVAGLSGFSFWSSTENDATTAKDLGNNQSPGNGNKASETPVRPIRAF